jgi:crossover junction endodeoxyribonuclease RuvC
VVIEHVHAFKGQGVTSMFNFGKSYGTALGVIGALKIPTIHVSPTKWKKYFGLSANKEEGRKLAIDKWPACLHFRRKKDHGRAEAALLAVYGAQTQR